MSEQWISKVLARAGVASRREIGRMIAAGRISLNGQVLTSPAVPVAADDRITVDGEPVGAAPATRLWRYHKPAGLLTTARDPQGRPTVFGQLPASMGRVVSVGRLDLNSEGLLLLTNDGGLARHFELPATGLRRQYRVRVQGKVTPAKLAALAGGMTVDGIRYGPVEAAPEKAQTSSNVWLRVVLQEGKNREIRKVMAAVDLRVNRLIRVAYGPFELGDLVPGQIEEVPAAVLRKAYLP